MTTLQKQICEILLEGGAISGNIKYGYRIKDDSGYPVLRFSHRTFLSIKPFLRMAKGQFVINKNAVRSLSKRYWLKQKYLQNLKSVRENIAKL